MAKVLVLYCSSYGYIEQMAQAVCDGSRQPGVIELADARHQGELVDKTDAKLFG